MSKDYSRPHSKGFGSPLMTIKNELLHGAVVRGELPTVKRLLDRHRADINTRNSNGLSCLQLAILNGHTKLAEYLIQKGVDIHVADPEGYTAIHDAAVVDNLLLVKKLIAKGLSPMLTTKMGELVIDVAGSQHLERVLCEVMYQAGEVQLAKEYYAYLNLGQDEEKTLGAHDGKRSLGHRGSHYYTSRTHSKHEGRISSEEGHVYSRSKKFTSQPRPSLSQVQFPGSLKTECKNTAIQSECQVSKNLPTHAFRVHPSVTSAEREITPALLPSGGRNNHQRSNLGNSPNYVVYEAGNHKNVTEEEAYKDPTKQLNTAKVPNRNQLLVDSRVEIGRDCISEVNSQSLSQVKFEVSEPLSFSGREYTIQKRNLSPQLSREADALKALYQHSSFQLQIGFSLQSQQFTDLDKSEDYFATGGQFSPTDPDSELADPISSLSSTQHTTTKPGYSQLTSEDHSTRYPQKSSLQRKYPRPLQTVSFADFPMTRSKSMFVGQSVNTSTSNTSNTRSNSVSCSTSASKSPETSNKSCERTLLQHSLSLPILDHFISYSKQKERPSKEEECEETDGMLNAGMRALAMKPRKSSIASSTRRRNSENFHRRRSVTFQPEVLLQEIVTDGDAKAVSEILESGMISDVNKMSPSGLTALHQSAIDGNLECAKALVAKGANVNCTDCESWTPLHAAVMNGSIEFVRFLLASGAKPNMKNDNGETAYDMTTNGPIRKMLLHAMNGKGLDADEFSDGEYSGDEEEKEYSHAESESDDELDAEGSGLFDSGGEQKTSLKDRLGLTHTSALNNAHSNSVSPSPDLDNVFTSNSQPHYHKREQEQTRSTSSYGSMFDSNERIDISEVRDSATNKIITVESDTDKVSESGISTMEGSSDSSHRSRMLSSEDEGITLDSDLDPGSLDYEFQEACLNCDVDRILKLVKYKCEIDVNRINKASGITALHHAVLEENFVIVQHLVKDFDSDLHLQDVDGWTPLHAASAVGSIQIAQFLLDRGAKPSSLNLSCEFPVDVAEDEAMEKLLKNAMLGHSTEKVLLR